jgi:hypothetical protein
MEIGFKNFFELLGVKQYLEWNDETREKRGPGHVVGIEPLIG